MDEGLTEALGFTWDRAAVTKAISVHTVERAAWRFQRSLPEFVWDAAVLEGNPFTFPEVQTLIDGITVGGRKLSDERQVTNLAEAAKELVRVVKSGEFRLDKQTSDRFQQLIARDEALEAGHFRGEGTLTLTPGVNLGEYGRYLPPATEPGGENLRRIHARGLDAILGEIDQPFEQGLIYFLFAALQQFYFDGNKRTGRYMMNGHLMSHGIDAISIPAARRLEFNTNMVEFYRRRDATSMVEFLTSCHPDMAEEAEAAGPA
jgi:Fic family protein